MHGAALEDVFIKLKQTVPPYPTGGISFLQNLLIDKTTPPSPHHRALYGFGYLGFLQPPLPKYVAGLEM